MVSFRQTVSLLAACAFLCVLAGPYGLGGPPASAQKTDDQEPATSQASSEPAVTSIDDRQIEEEIAAQTRRLLEASLDRDVELKDQEFSEAVELFRDLVNVGLAIRWGALEKAGVTGETKLSLKLQNPTGDELLRAILAAADPEGRLDYAIGLRDRLGRRLGPLCISTKEDIAHLRGAQSRPAN